MVQSDLTYYAHQSFDDCDKEMDDSQNMNYLQALNCLTNNVFYIFDYTRNKLICPDDLIEFLGHKFPLTNQGYSQNKLTTTQTNKLGEELKSTES